MRIALANPAPAGPPGKTWGDYHFGFALESALRRLRPGVEVRQDFWPHWSDTDEDDVVIVLRGKRRHQPTGRVPALLWVISHPSTVEPAELNQYSHILSGSRTFADYVAAVSTTPVSIARQCTDFHMVDATHISVSDYPRARAGMYFVANSRGYQRDIIRWALEAGRPPQIIGSHWDRVGLEHLVESNSIANDQLPVLYRRAKVSLNDHWADMRHFGIINNRVFDCLACGLPAITDSFPEISVVLGNTLLYAHDAASFLSAAETLERDYESHLQRIADFQPRLANEFSFDARANQILELIDAAGRDGASVSLHRRDLSGRPSPVESLIRDCFRAFGVPSHRRKRTVRVLHAFPSSVHAPPDVEDLQVSYHTVGFGDGPWQMSIDQRCTQVEHLDADLLVVDDHTAIDAIPHLERYDFLIGLSAALRSGATIALPESTTRDDWVRRFAHVGCLPTKTIGSWQLLSRRPHEEDALRQTVAYARSLERRVAHIYRSRTWRLASLLMRIRSSFRRESSAGNGAVPARPVAVTGNDPLESERKRTQATRPLPQSPAASEDE